MKAVTFPAVELVGAKRNAPLSRFPAPRFLSCEITCAHSARGILTAPLWTSEANIICEIQERVKFFEVVNDGVLWSPAPARIVLGARRPFLLMAIGSDTVVRVIKRRVVPVRPENLSDPASGLSFRSPLNFEGRLGRRVPEVSGRRYTSIPGGVHCDVEAVP